MVWDKEPGMVQQLDKAEQPGKAVLAGKSLSMQASERLHKVDMS